MTFKTLTSSLILGLTLLAAPASARAQAPAAPTRETSTVTSSASARVYRTPDYLDVQLAVETIAPTAQEAQATCTQTMEKALAALKALNLDKYEPQTGTVTLQPRYNNYRDDSERKIVGYTAINTIRVRTADLKASAKVIDTALTAGANRVDGISFGIREYLSAREEALTMAVKSAKRKAEVIATALDQRLGKVLTVNESSPSYYYPVNRMAQVQSANMAGGETGHPGEDAVVPGQIEVVVDVSISFVLDNK
ncbi:MAG: SIMPL domain-containing protein [Phycisphaerales bacterium]